jgi:lysophospholipase L1-like esterase
VIYCGDNDFAQDKTLPVDSVVSRLKLLVRKIRSVDNNVRITYVSIKPSPSRKEMALKFIEANRGIKQFLKSQKNTSFVDVYQKMVDKKGAPLKAIFLADSLHMNARGYAIGKKPSSPSC